MFRAGTYVTGMPCDISLGRAVLGHVDGIGQGAAAELAPESTDSTTCRSDAQRFGHPPGGLQLEAVPLAVIDRQGVERKARVPGDGGGRGRIEPPGKEDYGRFLGRWIGCGH